MISKSHGNKSAVRYLIWRKKTKKIHKDLAESAVHIYETVHEFRTLQYVQKFPRCALVIVFQQKSTRNKGCFSWRFLHTGFGLSSVFLFSPFLGTRKPKCFHMSDLKLARESATSKTLSLGSPSTFTASATYALPGLTGTHGLMVNVVPTFLWSPLLQLRRTTHFSQKS